MAAPSLVLAAGYTALLSTARSSEIASSEKHELGRESGVSAAWSAPNVKFPDEDGAFGRCTRGAAVREGEPLSKRVSSATSKESRARSSLSSASGVDDSEDESCKGRLREIRSGGARVQSLPKTAGGDAGASGPALLLSRFCSAGHSGTASDSSSEGRNT